MKTLITAALLLTAASFATLAAASDLKQDKPADVTFNNVPMAAMPPVAPTPDARTLASDQEVGEARRAYRAACGRHESVGFCECVTAGVSQALMPAEVRIAARTIGQRINAQGDAADGTSTDSTIGAESSAQRIRQVESHYADTCAQFRR